MDSLPSHGIKDGVVVHLWMVISVFGAKARIWFRMASKPNLRAFATLIPDLELLTEDDAQEATDIVNTLFTPDDALRFVEVLLSHPGMGSDHRIVNINKPGMRVLRRPLESTLTALVRVMNVWFVLFDQEFLKGSVAWVATTAADGRPNSAMSTSRKRHKESVPAGFAGASSRHRCVRCGRFTGGARRSPPCQR